MSFSIPTLRAFCNKIGGIATLNTPVISMVGDCGGCGPLATSGTITTDIGNRIAVRIGTYSDNFSLSCSNFDYLTTGNIAYLDNLGGQDHIGCVNRMPSGARIQAMACNGSAFSNIANEYLTAIACPTTIDPPTINVISFTPFGDLVYTVTSKYCHTTYFTHSDSSIFCQPPATINPSNSSTYKGTVTGSGVTSSTQTWNINCSTYNIVAVTYFNDANQFPSCTANLTATTTVTGP